MRALFLRVDHRDFFGKYRFLIPKEEHNRADLHETCRRVLTVAEEVGDEELIHNAERFAEICSVRLVRWQMTVQAKATLAGRLVTPRSSCAMA